MKIKLINENKTTLLNEIKMEQVLPRFESKAFLYAVEKNNQIMLKKAGDVNSDHFEYNELDKDKAYDFCISCIPNDIHEKYMPECLNWIITKFIQGNLFFTNSLNFVRQRAKQSLETFYQIKQLNLNRFLEESDIYKIDSLRDLLHISEAAAKLFKKYNEEKAYNKDWQKGAKVIHDDDLWTVYIPENKAAACNLGKGTEWCTAAPGLNYYEQYHKPHDPLIIFISKKDPTQKFQLHFGTRQFMDKDDHEIYNDLLLLYFFDIIKQNNNLPESVKIEAKLKRQNPDGYMETLRLDNLERTENGFYTKTTIYDAEEQRYYNYLFQLDRKEEEGPAHIKIYNNGVISEMYYKDDKLHAINHPAESYKDNSQNIVEWYYNGKRHNFNGPACYSSNLSSNSRLPEVGIEYYWLGSRTPYDHYVLIRNDCKKYNKEGAEYIKDDVVINESRQKDILKKINNDVVKNLFFSYQLQEKNDPRLNGRKFSNVYPIVIISCINEQYKRFYVKDEKQEEIVINFIKIKTFPELMNLVDNLVKLFGKLNINEKNSILSITSIRHFEDFIKTVSERMSGDDPKLVYKEFLDSLGGDNKIVYKDESRNIVVFAPTNFNSCKEIDGAHHWCIGRNREDWISQASYNHHFFIYFVGIDAKKFPFARSVMQIPAHFAEYGENYISDRELLEKCIFYNYNDSARDINGYVLSLENNHFLTQMNTTKEIYHMIKQILDFFRKGMLYVNVEDDEDIEDYYTDEDQIQ